MGIGVNEIIIYVMVVFAVLGGLDRIIGNKFGLGEKFEEGIMATGVLAGIVTILIGSFVGGLVGGYSIATIWSNLVPIIVFAVLIALGLWKCEAAMIKGFTIFGKIIVAIITVGLIAGIVEALTGIVVIPGMAPIHEGFAVVAEIGLVLAGAFPLMHVLTKVLNKPLMGMGKLLGMNETAAAGMVAALANTIPTFGMIKDMDPRGKVLNMAFLTSAGFVFGDHLGFTAGFNSEMIVPMIVGKLVSAVSAVAVAMFMLKGKKLED